MPDYIISLSGNMLRVSLFQNTEPFLSTKSKELDKSVVSDSEILDFEAFSHELTGLISEIQLPKAKNIPVYFLVEPDDVSMFFVTIDKKGGEEEDQVISGINNKLKEEGKKLEEMYFSYQKIAPFVFQFVGMARDKLETYLQIQTHSSIDLRGLLPWSLLLPKSVSIDGSPKIFIVERGDKKIIALSELNGIYYTGVYEEDKSPEELGKLIKDLSFYNRNTPISKIYTVNFDEFPKSASITVQAIPAGIKELDIDLGYALHIAAQQVLDSEESLLESQANILTALPVPTESKKNPLVYAGAALAALLLVGTVFGAYYFLNQDDGQAPPQREQLADTKPDSPTVLSENNEVEETTPSEEVAVEVDKSTVNIRVENGAGIEGIAGRTQEFLEALGYTVVSIGNADEVGRDTTLIRLNSSASEFRQMLEEDVGQRYDIEVEEDLEDGLEYDVLVVVGTS